MKNITLKVDDETYRKARIWAAQEGTSVSALVREFLQQRAKQNDIHETRVTKLEEIYRLADARQKPRDKVLQPFSREEIYRERLH